MTLQGVSANLLIQEGTKHSKHVYTPRKQVALWESPFKWTVEHLRGNPKDGIIKRLFDLAIGLVVALPIALTGIGALLLWREYVIEKEDEAFKSAQLQATAKRTKLIANNKKILKSAKTKAQQAIHSTNAQLEAERTRLNAQINTLETELNNRPSRQDWDDRLNQRANITPEALKKLQDRLNTFSQDLDSKDRELANMVTREQLQKAVTDAEALGAQGKVSRDEYNLALSQIKSLYEQYQTLTGEKQIADQTISDLKTACDERFSQLQQALQDNTHLKNQLEPMQRELASRATITPDELVNLENQLNLLGQHAKITQDQCNNLSTSYQSAQCELALAREQVNQSNLALQNVQQEAQRQIAGLKAKLDSLGNISKTDLDSLTDQLQKANEDITRLEDILNNKANENTALQEELETARQQITDLEARPEITTKDYQELQGKLAQAQLDLESRVNLNQDDYEQQLRNKLTEGYNQRELEIQDLKQQVANLDGKLNDSIPLATSQLLINALAAYHEQQGGNAEAFDTMAKQKLEELNPTLT